VAASAALFAPARLVRRADAAGIADQYAGLESGKFLGKVRTETQVRDVKIFTEGPAVDRDGCVFFTNVAAEKILKWDPAAKTLSVFRENSNQTNGLLFDPNGNLLACEGGAGRITRTNMRTGEVTVVADKFNGFPFAAPNDVALDGQGRLYFSSRPGVEDPSQGNVNAVYRIDPDGTVDQILAWPKIHMPNGLVTSPDDKTLYVIESHPDANRHRCIQAYDLTRDGTVANERTLIDFYPGRSGDGMCVDAEGNLYVAAGLHKPRGTSETLDTKPGIHVISTKGTLLAFAETPEDTITNCRFGGKDLRTLYVTCGSRLLSIRTAIPGKMARA
jgi:gluconolactonase